MKTRSYTQRARAEAVDSRRDAVLDAMAGLIFDVPFEDITLQAVAERAGVSLKTVTRQFGSKEGIITAVVRRNTAREASARAVVPGDVGGVVTALTHRYEAMASLVVRRIALEDRVPAIRQAADLIRQTHLDWLAEAFSPWLPADQPGLRPARLAALFTATEIYSWWSLIHLGFTPEQARAAMHDTLTSLTQLWQSRRIE